MTQNEVRWLLSTIYDNWPETFLPDYLARIDRDDPLILETGERSTTVDLQQWTFVGASLGNVVRSPLGTEFHYDLETVVDVRVEGLHESEYGLVSDSEEFTRLVNRIQYAIDAARTYPDIDPDGDDIGRVHYLDGQIEDDTPQLSQTVDHYRRDFSVRLRGRQPRP